MDTSSSLPPIPEDFDLWEIHQKIEFFTKIVPHRHLKNYHWREYAGVYTVDRWALKRQGNNYCWIGPNNQEIPVKGKL